MVLAMDAKVGEGLRGRAAPLASGQQGKGEALLQAQQQVAFRMIGEQVAHARLLR
ncbi:hypothetical protein D3C76_1249800 [compost metagenome]